MNIKSTSVDCLFQAMLSLKSVEEYYDFFEDLCTIKEVQDMANRFNTAVLLDEGLNYQTISKQLGVSTATITRVSKCLNYGSGGYKKVLERLKKNG